MSAEVGKEESTSVSLHDTTEVSNEVIMMKAYIIGTIKKIDVANNDYILTIKEHDNLLLILDGDFYKRDFAKLKKGGHFLFEGHLRYANPVFVVRDTVTKLSPAKLEQLTKQSQKDHTLLTVSGKMSDVKVCQTQIKKQELAYAKFKDFSDIAIVIFPDKYKTFRAIYKKNKTISVYGELLAYKPEFIVKKAKKLS